MAVDKEDGIGTIYIDMRQRRLMIGDIHGQYRMLLDVLEKAGFRNGVDILYSTGDFCDRGEDTVPVIRFLMTLENFYPVLGNHDAWLERFLLQNEHPNLWLEYNGGHSTISSFIRENVSDQEKRKIGQWYSRIPSVRIEDDFILVHGGFSDKFTMDDIEMEAKLGRGPGAELYDYDEKSFIWDRSYFESAEHWERKTGMYCDARLPLVTDKTIFVGHTPLYDRKPFHSERYHLWNVDTGAARYRTLTVMDIDTKECWTSDYKDPEDYDRYIEERRRKSAAADKSFRLPEGYVMVYRSTDSDRIRHARNYLERRKAIIFNDIEDEKGNIYANYCNNLSEDGYKNIYVREEDAEKARERLREAEEADRRWSKTDKPSCIL